MAYPQKKVDEALALVDTGKSHSEVGRLMGIPQVTISVWCRNRHANNNVAPVSIPEPHTAEPTPALPVQEKIALSSLCLTAGTQMRESLNLATIADYADSMSDGSKFPPVIVFTDGTTYWLGDGFQRVKAAEQVGYVEIEAEIRPGTLRDAILFSCGANAHHGERRTNADKRKSVLTLLKDTEWTQLSDRRIADICGVTHPFVAEMRKSLVPVVTVTTPNHYDETNTR
jgi:hypothetical protein